MFLDIHLMFLNVITSLNYKQMFFCNINRMFVQSCLVYNLCSQNIQK